jgi:hypothetical protein
MADNNRIEVPHWMLDADTVAQFFPMAAKEEFVCVLYGIVYCG